MILNVTDSFVPTAILTREFSFISPTHLSYSYFYFTSVNSIKFDTCPHKFNLMQPSLPYACGVTPLAVCARLPPLLLTRASSPCTGRLVPRCQRTGNALVPAPLIANVFRVTGLYTAFRNPPNPPEY